MVKFLKFWEGFRQNAMHPEAPPTQVRECRLSFYAGAYAMFEAMNEATGGDVSEEKSVEYIETLRTEIKATLDGIARSRPGRGHH